MEKGKIKFDDEYTKDIELHLWCDPFLYTSCKEAREIIKDFDNYVIWFTDFLNNVFLKKIQMEYVDVKKIVEGFWKEKRKEER
jgi:hypothetical protein